MPMNVWMLNLIVFAVLLEADLGRRKIGGFRVLCPLITTAAIVPAVPDQRPGDWQQRGSAGHRR